MLLLLLSARIYADAKVRRTTGIRTNSQDKSTELLSLSRPHASATRLFPPLLERVATCGEGRTEVFVADCVCTIQVTARLQMVCRALRLLNRQIVRQTAAEQEASI